MGNNYQEAQGTSLGRIMIISRAALLLGRGEKEEVCFFARQIYWANFNTAYSRLERQNWIPLPEFSEDLNLVKQQAVDRYYALIINFMDQIIAQFADLVDYQNWQQWLERVGFELPSFKFE